MRRLATIVLGAFALAAQPIPALGDPSGEPAQVREQMHAIAEHVASFAGHFGIASMETDALGLAAQCNE